MGVLEREDRDKDNETGLKEGGGIEMSTTVLHSRAAPSLENRFEKGRNRNVYYSASITRCTLRLNTYLQSQASGAVPFGAL